MTFGKECAVWYQKMTQEDDRRLTRVFLKQVANMKHMFVLNLSCVESKHVLKTCDMIWNLCLHFKRSTSLKSYVVFFLNRRRTRGSVNWTLLPIGSMWITASHGWVFAKMYISMILWASFHDSGVCHGNADILGWTMTMNESGSE